MDTAPLTSYASGSAQTTKAGANLGMTVAAVGEAIVATSTDADGNSSEFSTVFTVTCGSGSGAATTPLVHTGGSDNLILRLNACANRIEIVNADDGEIVAAAAEADTSNVVINTLDGNDTLTVDETNGLVNVPGGIQYDGGAGADSLRLVGTTPVSATYSVGPDAGSGAVVHTITAEIGAATQNVRFHNLEPVIDLVPGPLTVNGTAAANAINFNTGPNSGTSAVGGAASGQVQIDNFESIEFANKTDVTINALAGSDTTGISTFSAGFSGALTLNGGDPADGDKVVVNGTTGNDTFIYDPSASAADAGRIQLAARGLDFIGTESVFINGLGGADSLTGNPAAVGDMDDVIAWTPAGDDGVVRYNASTPVSYVSIEARTFTAGGSLAGDQFLVSGTSNNDMVTVVAGAGTVGVTLNGELGTFTFASDETDVLTVNLGDGDDATTVTPSADLDVTVNGGDPSASDRLTIAGQGAGISIDTAANTVTEIGLGAVSFSGIEHVTVDAATKNVAVTGTASDDQIDYRPTSAETGSIQRTGHITLFNLTSVGTLTVDLLGGQDRLVVQGTVAGETITVDATSVAVSGRQPVSHTNTEAVSIFGYEGADTFDVTPGATPIFIDGGDPIGAGTVQDVINLLPSGTSFSLGNYQPGPEPDEGSLVVGGTPISFDHIEDFKVSLDGFEEIELLSADQRFTPPWSVTYASAQTARRPVRSSLMGSFRSAATPCSTRPVRRLWTAARWTCSTRRSLRTRRATTSRSTLTARRAATWWRGHSLFQRPVKARPSPAQTSTRCALTPPHLCPPAQPEVRSRWSVP